MSATAVQKLARLTDGNARLPLKPLVLPPYPKSLLARFPELEGLRNQENALLKDWIDSANVTLAPTPKPPS